MGEATAPPENQAEVRVSADSAVGAQRPGASPTLQKLNERVAGVRAAARHLNIAREELGPIPDLSSDLGRWYAEQSKQLDNLNFERWFAQKFNLQNVAELELARRISPEFFRKRLETLKANCDLAMKIGTLEIMGAASSKELLDLEYALDNGIIRPPGANFWNLVRPLDVYGGGDNALLVYQRGWLDPPPGTAFGDAATGYQGLRTGFAGIGTRAHPGRAGAVYGDPGLRAPVGPIAAPAGQIP